MPGWRALAPDELGHRIEDVIRTRGRRAVRVIERTRPAWSPSAPGAGVGVASWLTTAVAWLRFVAQFGWQLVATRSWPERIAWLAWIWGAALLVWWRRSRSDS